MKKIILIIVLLFSFCMVNAKELDITVESISVSDKSDTLSITDPDFSEGRVKSNITFNNLDEYVTYNITLKNMQQKIHPITVRMNPELNLLNLNQ